MASINNVMPRISRQGDRCRTGHLCSKSAPVNASQFSVFANGKPILVRGDKVAVHFIKGIGVGRRGDRADFGAMTGASFDVFAG